MKRKCISVDCQYSRKCIHQFPHDPHIWRVPQYFSKILPTKRHFPTFHHRTSSFYCLPFFCIRLSKDAEQVNKISVGSEKLPHTLFFHFKKKTSSFGDSSILETASHTETAFFLFLENPLLIKALLKISAPNYFFKYKFQTSVVELFWRNSQRLMAVACFCRRAPSWIFNRILNTTLPNSLL